MAVTEPPRNDRIGETVQEITSRAQLLVREEIELAKTEVQAKVQSLGKAAAVGAAAGLFVVLGVIFALHTIAWALADLFNNIELGYLVTTVILFLLAGGAGFLAYRFVKKGTPPKPEMAIEEAKRIRETVQESR